MVSNQSQVNVYNYILFTASHFEFWFLSTHKCINPNLRVVVGIKDFHESEIKGIVRSEITEGLFSMANSLLALDLTWEEITLLRGVVVTFTGKRVHLNNKCVTCTLQRHISSFGSWRRTKVLTPTCGSAWGSRPFTKQRSRASFKLMSWSYCSALLMLY